MLIEDGLAMAMLCCVYRDRMVVVLELFTMVVYNEVVTTVTNVYFDDNYLKCQSFTQSNVKTTKHFYGKDG